MNSTAEAARLRVFHRQMYVDLIRSYLQDYGSQRDLARALRLSEAYVSFLLEPLRVPGAPRPRLYWASALTAPDFEIFEAFRFLKTPSEDRARQLASVLCTESDRCDALLYHISMAQASSQQHESIRSMPGDEARDKLALTGHAHQIVQRSPDVGASKSAHAQVWSMAAPLVDAVDPLRSPLEYTQALLYLHDIAQVWDLHAQALAFARRAILALFRGDIRKQQRDEAHRLRVVSMHAEAVSLNTLGLSADSRRTVGEAMKLLDRSEESRTWQRALLEQELTALVSAPRISIYQAEKIAEDAITLGPADVIAQAAAGYRLLNIYTAHPSPRNSREGGKLAARLRTLAPSPCLTPLRRVQVLRGLYRYSRTLADSTAISMDLSECLRVTYEGSLFHQQREVLRDAGRKTRLSAQPRCC